MALVVQIWGITKAFAFKCLLNSHWSLKAFSSRFMFAVSLKPAGSVRLKLLGICIDTKTQTKWFIAAKKLRNSHKLLIEGRSRLRHMFVIKRRHQIIATITQTFNVFYNNFPFSPNKVAFLRVDTQTILTIQSNVITKNHRVGISFTEKRTWQLRLKDIRESDKGWWDKKILPKTLINKHWMCLAGTCVRWDCKI